MRRFLIIAAAAVVAFNVHADSGLITKESAHSVQDTLDKLDKIVTEKGFTVFARVDHSAGAEKVGEELRPTQLLIFGNPKAGTPLMQKAQSMGLDLPIRVAAWEDSEGKVWLGYNDPNYLANRHGVTEMAPLLEKMTGALGGLTDAAASP